MSFEPRHENKNCPACPKDHFQGFPSFQFFKFTKFSGSQRLSDFQIFKMTFAHLKINGTSCCAATITLRENSRVYRATKWTQDKINNKTSPKTEIPVEGVYSCTSVVFRARLESPPQYNIYIIVFTRDYTNWSPGRDPGTAAPPPPVATTETYLPIHQQKIYLLKFIYLPLTTIKT